MSRINTTFKFTIIQYTISKNSVQGFVRHNRQCRCCCYMHKSLKTCCNCIVMVAVIDFLTTGAIIILVRFLLFCMAFWFTLSASGTIQAPRTCSLHSTMIQLQKSVEMEISIVGVKQIFKQKIYNLPIHQVDIEENCSVRCAIDVNSL